MIRDTKFIYDHEILLAEAMEKSIAGFSKEYFLTQIILLRHGEATKNDSNRGNEKRS